MPTVVVLVAVHLALFVITARAAPRATVRVLPPETLLRFGALYPPAVRRRQWHRVFNAMFLHLGVEHLLTNLVALVSMAVLVLPDYGRVRFVAIYVLSGVAGSLASVLWRREVDPVVTPPTQRGWRAVVRAAVGFGAPRSCITAGASAAICGLVAAGAVRGLHADNEYGAALGQALLEWAIFVLACGAVTEADNVGHLGGMIGGAVAGAFLAVDRNAGVAIGGIGIEMLLLVAAVAGGLVLARRVRDPELSYASQLARADELRAAGAWDESIRAYRRALWLVPGGADAHRGLARALTGAGDYVDALEAAEAATACDPASDDAHAMVETCMAKLGRR